MTREFTWVTMISSSNRLMSASVSMIIMHSSPELFWQILIPPQLIRSELAIKGNGSNPQATYLAALLEVLNAIGHQDFTFKENPWCL